MELPKDEGISQSNCKTKYEPRTSACAKNILSLLEILKTTKTSSKTLREGNNVNCVVTKTSSCIIQPPLICSRNAFMHFLNAYRTARKVACCPKIPASLIATEAGRAWKQMSLNDKYPYVKAARSVGYVYRTKNKRMNRVFKHFRNALCNEKGMNALSLMKTVKEMELWKRQVMKMA